MKIKRFETVDNIPALYDEELDILVISDLHLGLEGSMTSEGSYVPKFNLEDVIEDIEKARSMTEASRILVNGDLKNEFKKSYYSERTEVTELLQHLKRRFEEVMLVEGNHDRFIQDTVESEGLEMYEFILVDDILFIHGDERPEEIESLKEDFDTVVIGHEHPALSLKDDIGISEKIPCFLYGETHKENDIIVLPAFSRISNGTSVNEVPKSKLLSPVLKKDTDPGSLKAVGVSREAGLFSFPEISRF